MAEKSEEPISMEPKETRPQKLTKPELLKEPEEAK